MNSLLLPPPCYGRFGWVSSARTDEHTEDAKILRCYSLISSWWPSPHRWLAGGRGCKVFTDRLTQAISWNYLFWLLSLPEDLALCRAGHAQKAPSASNAESNLWLKAGKNKRAEGPVLCSMSIFAQLREAEHSPAVNSSTVLCSALPCPAPFIWRQVLKRLDGSLCLNSVGMSHVVLRVFISRKPLHCQG